MQNECTKSILVVDDEPAVCELVRAGLADLGYPCLAVSDPHAAREMIAGHAIDLLITDIAMPGMTGLELLAHARRRAPHCKVVLVTGVSSQGYLAEAMEQGAFDYLEKPFTLARLEEVVLGALGPQAEGDTQPAGAHPGKGTDAESARNPLGGPKGMPTRSQSPFPRQVSWSTIQTLVRAIEAKDPYTRWHSEQVAGYSWHLAGALQVPQQLRQAIRLAALVHDVGKIGVPDRVLTKAGPLTEEELNIMRRHPAVGADILGFVADFDVEVHIVRHHHEAWNGSGYPDRLVGEEAPLGSRIIHMADAMDAMLMRRSYREAYPVEKMIDELIRCAGTQFDPRIAAAAVLWCRHNAEKLVLPVNERA
jgi:response regulator RpfG family c-di-GMP phosphodiesterase